MPERWLLQTGIHQPHIAEGRGFLRRPSLGSRKKSRRLAALHDTCTHAICYGEASIYAEPFIDGVRQWIFRTYKYCCWTSVDGSSGDARMGGAYNHDVE